VFRWRKIAHLVVYVVLLGVLVAELVLLVVLLAAMVWVNL
jgi:hypothetical protein